MRWLPSWISDRNKTSVSDHPIMINDVQLKFNHFDSFRENKLFVF